MVESLDSPGNSRASQQIRTPTRISLAELNGLATQGRLSQKQSGFAGVREKVWGNDRNELNAARTLSIGGDPGTTFHVLADLFSLRPSLANADSFPEIRWPELARRFAERIVSI